MRIRPAVRCWWSKESLEGIPPPARFPWPVGGRLCPTEKALTSMPPWSVVFPVILEHFSSLFLSSIVSLGMIPCLGQRGLSTPQRLLSATGQMQTSCSQSSRFNLIAFSKHRLSCAKENSKLSAVCWTVSPLRRQSNLVCLSNEKAMT